MGDKRAGMGYLFLMTFAGSALFIGYLCWEKMLKKSMTQCMKYKALLVVMLAYAVPFISALYGQNTKCMPFHQISYYPNKQKC